MSRAGFASALVVAICAMLYPAAAQEVKPSEGTLAIVSTVPPELAAAAVQREIDDPGSHLRWLLVEDPSHPGGPGRMVAMGAGAGSASRRAAAVAKAKPVVRSGDVVQVEEHSAVVDASLQAVALNSAALGERIRVRLLVGGRVIAAVVLGPGRAALQPAGGAQ